jgi:peptidyl-tRNA hydrolase
MKMFINEAREKGAIPVLVSPMVMNAWNNAGMRNVFTENGNNYRGAMAEVADEMKCAFVDLNMKSYNLFKTTSANYCSRFFYHTYPAGEYPNYPNGSSDGTHFQEMGALTLCKLVTDGLKESEEPFIQSLVNYMKPQYTLTVKANKDKSGDITMSNSFPEGAPITVKVLPSNGSKFVNWSRDGKNVSSKTLYRFSMGSQNTELTAIFEGGAAVDTVEKIDFPEGKKRVAYITDPNAANYANDTKILPALKACDSLFVYEVDATKNNVDLADFDMVVISEVAASTAARIASLKNADKPSSPLSDWFAYGCAKVCVYVDSEEALLDIARKAQERGMIASVITDAGMTEFHGVPTKTCLALEPLPAEIADELTGDLPLY